MGYSCFFKRDRHQSASHFVHLLGGGLLRERGVTALGHVLAAAREDDELSAVLFQASNVGLERLLLNTHTIKQGSDRGRGNEK